MTNFEEAKLMLNPIYIQQIAEGVCAGVCQYLDVLYIPRNDLSAYPTLRRGNQGNKVVLLQYLLNRYGYSLIPDGLLGSRTYSAVIDFQRRNGLNVDGVVGNNTWNALLNPQGKTVRFGNRNATVWYLQQMLLSKLYPIGEIDGIFGNATLNAVREFQSENRLNVDGIVGPATWRVLDTVGG
ncbi:MAG: peptidoglycan-binding protein, partial [Clostridia bacterium]|nr:peptidoglycan-binding protein [Clostridia bacterium]